ncbi:ricin-type beta-trefoil lectin domain protein [Streptacidiphilus sp. MAP5-3]|uniref:LamG-like jellyroll fold domain-containing protein n=1 Tax=unclassified Streptacidiphilus TaxID=2643834 RepID=UPI00351724AE
MTPRWALVPLAVSLAVTGLTAPAFASSGLMPDPTPSAGPDPSTPSTSPVATALAQASSTGQPVVVASATTQTEQLTANPDGTLSFTDSLLPVRVQQYGAWTPVNAALAENSDGSYSPAATPSGLVLSGGGAGPLATMTDPAGGTVSYSLPFSLPAPTVTGSTALYASVLPGVDLSVRVTDQGGFAETLVVHDATAAANPDLKTLTLSATAKGLTLGTDAQGDLQAAASDGTVYFTAPKPVMWDSSTGGASTAATPQAQVKSMATTADATASPSPSSSGSPTSSPSPSPSSTTATASGSGDTTTSTAAAPGTGAQVDPVGMGVSTTQVTLTPDQNLLTGSGTTYPVYIDPSINPTNTTKNTNYDEIYSSSECSGSPQYNTPQTDGEGAGYQQWGDGCGIGLERSLYTLALPSGIPTDATVIKSQVDAWDTYAASWSCSQEQPVTLHTVGSIGSGTDWNNQPGTNDGNYPAVSTTVASGSNSSSSCSNEDAVFTVTSQMQSLVNAGVSNWTVELRGDETESSSNANFLRFSTQISVTTTLDVPPNTPTGYHTTPQSINPTGPGCNNTGNGWIGASGASGVTFTGTLSTDMSGENLAADFDIWDNSLNNGSGGATVVNNKTVGWVGSGGSESTSITPQDGHSYGWAIRGEDDTSLHLTSPWVTECHFVYDATPPATPAVTAGDPSFPQVGNGAANPVQYAGSTTQLSVQVSATDPLPANTCTAGTCQASGVDHFLWKLDGQPTVLDNGGSVGDSSTGTDSTGAPTAAATITAPLPNWGVHTLYIAAVDKAGNLSQVPTSYTFYVPWNPNTKIMAGDLSGDQIPDLVAVTKTGDLDMISGDSGPGASPTLLSTAAQSPAGDGWNNYYLAHRGSAVGGKVDDLFAYDHNTTGTGAKHMFIVVNDINAPSGTPGSPTSTPGFTLGLHTDITNQPSCLIKDTTRCGSTVGQPSDWSQVTGLTAAGDLIGNGNSTFVIIPQTKPGTTTRQLWLYQTTTGPSLINPVLLGDGDWTGFTLTEGNVGSTYASGSWTPGTPTLFARDDATGSVYSFPLTLNTPETRQDGTSENIPALLHAPVHTALQSAVVPSSGNLCVDDNKQGTTDGNVIQVWTCNNSIAQSWTAAADGSLRVLGKCMDATSGGTANGTLIQLYQCDGTGSQVWQSGANGSLINPQSGKCLADPSSNTTNGTQLILWTCDGGPEQNWTSSATAGWDTSPATALAPVLPASQYPGFASPGDVNSPSGGPDGNPDLYVADTNGQLIEYPGAAPSGTTAVFGSPISLGTVTNTATDWWNLSEGSGSTAADSLNSAAANQLTLNGSSDWKADATLVAADPTLQNNPTGESLLLDGTTQYGSTSGQTIATTGSYTVSAWAKLTTAPGASSYYTVLAQRDATGARCGFYLQYSSALHGWALVSPSSDSTSPTTYYSAGYGNTPAVGAWTHLVGVFDAITGNMSLYINGHLAGSGNDPTPWDANGPFLVGGSDNAGTGSQANFPGQIADVHVYNTALPDADAAALGDNTTITNLN